MAEETPTPTKTDEPKKLEFIEESPVVTHHSANIGGKELKYSATAGRMPLRNQWGEIEGQVFYIAYTLDGAKPEKRNLMFSFNGGPGSPSLWLHLGALGPKRIPMANDGEQPEPPYHLVDNDASWLEFTDLVFIDPIGTGFSQAKDDKLAEKYWSMTGDIESVSEFIRLYLVKNARFSSPLFLVGESYGTTRAAGISKHLVERGIAFNGLVLVSSAMNFLSLDFIQSSDLPHILFLPTYAATAWYHNALPRKRPSLKSFLKEVEAFAGGEYASILLKGDKATPRETKNALDKLHRFTGISRETLENSRLKIEIMQFCKELLRKKRRTVGRLDSRITGFDADPTGHKIEHDPSMSALMPPYTMAFNDYVRRALKYETDLKYHVFHGITKPWTWDMPKDEPPDTSHALRDAMLRNPHMRVFVASGYYDLATPYFATEYTLSHLGLEPELRAKIETEEYEAGHMMYTHEGCLQKLVQDVKKFVVK